MSQRHLQLLWPTTERDDGPCQESTGICCVERHFSSIRKPELKLSDLSQLALKERWRWVWMDRLGLAITCLHVRGAQCFSKSTLHRRLFALLLAGLVFAVPRPSAAAFECNDSSWEGASEFLVVARAIAGTLRVKLVAELDFGTLTPDDSVLFLHPEVVLDDQSLGAFVQQGGRAAVLDDFGKSTAFSERFGINRVQAPTDPAEVLRGNVHLAVGTPVETIAADGTPQRHPLVRDVDRVVLNHPTGLTNPGLTPVLEVRTRSGGAIPVAVTGVVGTTQAGRLLVMSDPSAFINLMIRYPGNLAFARAVVRYLAEDDGRTGKGRLFIVANRFDQTGRYSTTHGPLSDALDGIEQLIHELKQGMPPPMLITLAAVAGFAIVRWIISSMWRGAPHALPRSLRPIPLTSQAGWPGRAAVLLSPTTHATLLLVELREAFRLRLTQIAGVDATVSSQALVVAVEARNLLPAELLGSLRNLLAEVDSAERAVVARRPIRVKQAMLTRLLRQSLDILDHISQLERHHREPSPPS